MGGAVAGSSVVYVSFVILALALIPAESAHGLVLWTDSETYESGQRIIIFGNVEVVPTGDAVTILILSENNTVMDILQAEVDETGNFAGAATIKLPDGRYFLQSTYNDVPGAPASFQIGPPEVDVEPEAVEPVKLEEPEEPETATPTGPPESAPVQLDLPSIGFELPQWAWIALVIAAIATALAFWRTRKRGSGGAETWQSRHKEDKRSGEKIVFLDTNICISYMFLRITAGAGPAGQYVMLKRAQKMNTDLPSKIDKWLHQNRLRVPDTTTREFASVLYYPISEKEKTAIGVPIDSKTTMYDLVGDELGQLNQENRFIQLLLDGSDSTIAASYSDSDLERVKSVREKLKIDDATMKSGRIKKQEDVLGEGDMEILATALSFSKKTGAKVYLLTTDSDFLKRGESLRKHLGVEIESGFAE